MGRGFNSTPILLEEATVETETPEVPDQPEEQPGTPEPGAPLPPPDEGEGEDDGSEVQNGEEDAEG